MAKNITREVKRRKIADTISAVLLTIMGAAVFVMVQVGFGIWEIK